MTFLNYSDSQETKNNWIFAFMLVDEGETSHPMPSGADQPPGYLTNCICFLIFTINLRIAQEKI